MKIKSLIPWVSRGLSILITLVLYAFIFELTPAEFEWQNIFLAALPGTIMLVLTAISWSFPRPGGLIFILLGLIYAVLGWYRISYLAIGLVSGGLIIAGTGFILSQKNKKITKKLKKKEKKLKVVNSKDSEEKKNNDQPDDKFKNLTPEKHSFPKPIKTEDVELEPILPETTVITPPQNPESQFKNKYNQTSTEFKETEPTVVEPLLITDPQEKDISSQQKLDSETTKSQPENTPKFQIPPSLEETVVEEKPKIITDDLSLTQESTPEDINIFEEESVIKETNIPNQNDIEGISGFEGAQLISLEKGNDKEDQSADLSPNEESPLPELKLVTEKAPTFQDFVEKAKKKEEESVLSTTKGGDDQQSNTEPPTTTNKDSSTIKNDFLSWFDEKK